MSENIAIGLICRTCEVKFSDFYANDRIPYHIIVTSTEIDGFSICPRCDTVWLTSWISGPDNLIHEFTEFIYKPS